MTSANFTLGGTSTAPTITYSGTAIPSGLKLEIGDGTSFVVVTPNTAISTGVYPAATTNLFDNSTANGTLNSSFTYKISLSDATNTVLYDSSDTTTPTISGGNVSASITPTLNANFSKIITTVTIAPTATGNTGDFTITDGNFPNNTEIKYTLYDGANAVTGATNLSGSDLTN